MSIANVENNRQFAPYQRLILSPLGLNRENGFAFWLLLLFGSVTLGGLWFFEGDLPVVLGILYVIGIFILSFLRIDISFYILMFGVMISDQYGIPGFTPFTHELGFLSNLKEISWLPFFDAGVINPVEMHLIFLFFSLLVQVSINKNLSFIPVPAWIPGLLFFLTLSGSFIYGIVAGGDFLVALWEVRALFYLCIFYLLVPQIIRTKKQIRILMWIFIICISFKALQGVGRFVGLGFTTSIYEVLTNHEDPVFAVTLFIMLIGCLLYDTGRKQRLSILILLLPLLIGFYVAQRRAAYASFLVCLMTFVVLLPAERRWHFMKYFLPLCFMGVLYTAAFWNHGGALGRPIQMIRSGIEQPDMEMNYRDYNSNRYREFENYDLAYTARNNPLYGIGFGQEYDQPIPLIEIPFPLMDYIPHNQIFWVIVKMGGIGFFAFWFFFNSVAATGTQFLMRLKDPYLSVVCLVAVIAIINQMVISYFDLQLTYYRNMIYLGTLMGLVPAVRTADQALQDDQRLQKKKLREEETSREYEL